MSIQREGRRIRLSETKTPWEDKSTSEVAAGKLEVMEKFFTPLPHSSNQRLSQSSQKEKSSWEGSQNHYYKESMSSSSPSSSSSPWSSEFNFRVHAPGYNSRATHSRSCNDLSLGKARENEGRGNFVLVKQDASQSKRSGREGIDHFSPVRSGAGSAKTSHLGESKEGGSNNKSGKEDKIILKNESRRARSMEALAEKQSRHKVGKDKRQTTEEKQRFSRFLDEITIQVLSPSMLNSLGVKERQNSGNRDQWKKPSTDNLGSQGKTRSHNSEEHKDKRKKGKGKIGSATKAKLSGDTTESWRRRERSTSPDSVTSSAQHRGDREKTNLSALNVGHQSTRRTSWRLSQEKSGKLLEHTDRDKKDGDLSKVPKGKGQYTEKAQNRCLLVFSFILHYLVKEESWQSCVYQISEHIICTAGCRSVANTLESATKVPIMAPPAWWGDSGSPAASQYSDKNTENLSEQSRRFTGFLTALQMVFYILRIQEEFLGTQPFSQKQNTNLNFSSENSVQDKDSLNQRITELLDHLVQAKSTICALEKLNVSSNLHNLHVDVLDSVKVPDQGSDGSIQKEGIACSPSSCAVTSQLSNLAISTGNLKYTKEEKVESQSAPRVTAFSLWSPRRQKSFSALHTLYTSTESGCNLEDTPPTCKLLSPRFPNLGESFSEDPKDVHIIDDCDSRSEQKHLGASKSSLPLPSLLPAHQTPQHNHQSRASSTESSGDDPLIMSWTDPPSYEPPLDYHSAQKIFDTLLGLKTPETKISKHETAGGFSSVDASRIDGHPLRSEYNYSDNPKNMSYLVVNKDSLHTSCGQHSQHDNILCPTHSPLPSPASDSAYRLYPDNRNLPPLPAKRTLIPGSFVNVCPGLSPVGELDFHPVGKSEGLSHHKSYCLIPTSYVSSPMQFTDSANQHPDQFVLKSPLGSEFVMRNWEEQSHQQEGQRERKPRKERTVTFSTMNNDGQSKQSLLTARSKFMPNKIADQGQEGSTSMDSTLL
ncbi:uncharacterized protein [Pyxicephalus adspersus]|uniref:uncharacterized protein isoform X2 n=1 Tax=Pyxicephalus adspersus TaxID=30357 RepID=UPI003B5B0CC6